MLPRSMVKVVYIEYSSLIFQSNLFSLMQSTCLLLCVGIADTFLMFTLFSCGYCVQALILQT